MRQLPRVTVPAFQVDLVAEARGGAWPTGCYGQYPHDETALLAYLSESEAGRGAEWIQSVLDGRIPLRGAA